MCVPSFSVKTNVLSYIIVPTRLFEELNETLTFPSFSIYEAVRTLKLPSPKLHVPETKLPELAKLIVVSALLLFNVDAFVSASVEALEPSTAETTTESNVNVLPAKKFSS